jgi:hypothetical protein
MLIGPDEESEQETNKKRGKWASESKADEYDKEMFKECSRMMHEALSAVIRTRVLGL